MEQEYVSVSRPRRFGKSMAVNMLCAYYGKGDSREVFAGMKLAGRDSWDRYLNHFDVIRVVMTDFIKQNKDVVESLAKMQKLVVRDIRKEYPDLDTTIGIHDSEIIQKKKRSDINFAFLAYNIPTSFVILFLIGKMGESYADLCGTTR